MTESRTTSSARRYETFVIRLWVEDDAPFEHGEIRHVNSNHGIRFRDIDRAFDFIRSTLGSPGGRARHE